MNVLKHCRHGLMVHNKNDMYIGKSLNEYGEFSQEEVNLFNAFIKKDDVVFDIVQYRHPYRRFLKTCRTKRSSFMPNEPQRLIYYTLCANIAVNNITNVYCLQNAVGNKDGRVEIPELDSRKTNNFGDLQLGIHYPNATSSCSVRLIKLDNLNLERVDFIKMDRSMEPEAVMGAKELINKHRPLLYLEADRPENMSLIVKLIRGLNYNIHFHSPLLYSPDNYDQNYNNIFGSSLLNQHAL